MVIALSGWGAQVRSLSESVVALSANVTRPLPRARALNLGAWTAAPPPYPPPQAGEGREGASRIDATGAEAPRPAHARIDGRSPGSRVIARHRLPGFPQWLSGVGRPHTVAGAAAALEAPSLPSPACGGGEGGAFRPAFPVISL